eukprot:TRINITY_DN26097_c0_g1_i1.p1 TRINITY_DN26097_c0_g1~~TRINITY_DN26097_c0_g1_i1.p1  ORF type:complete len:243 (-),score=55.07 TRINITY_DN26097_c0_g1_i1:19-747(-)
MRSSQDTTTTSMASPGRCLLLEGQRRQRHRRPLSAQAAAGFLGLDQVSTDTTTTWLGDAAVHHRRSSTSAPSSSCFFADSESRPPRRSGRPLRSSFAGTGPIEAPSMQMGKPPPPPAMTDIGPSPPEAFSTQMHIDTIVGGKGRSGAKAAELQAREEALFGAALAVFAGLLVGCAMGGEHLMARWYRNRKKPAQAAKPKEKASGAGGGDDGPAAQGRRIQESNNNSGNQQPDGSDGVSSEEG